MKNTMIRTLVFPIVTLAMLLTASGAHTATRTEGAGDVPYYARIEEGAILHTDDWAAIIFYRPPGCVPPDFNLLGFYDLDATCGPLTTDGFIIWSGEPEHSDPIQVKLDGLGAVPVWFVSWPELNAAVADEVLTMSELKALQTLLRVPRIFTQRPYIQQGERNHR